MKPGLHHGMECFSAYSVARGWNIRQKNGEDTEKVGVYRKTGL